MNYLARATIVATIVIILGTAAFAVAETHRATRPEDISIVVAPMASADTTGTARPAIAATPTTPPVVKPSKAPTAEKPAPSSSRTPKKKKSASAGKKSTAPDTSAGKAPATPEPNREVVKPEVRDDEHSSDGGSSEDSSDESHENAPVKEQSTDSSHSSKD